MLASSNKEITALMPFDDVILRPKATFFQGGRKETLDK